MILNGPGISYTEPDIGAEFVPPLPEHPREKIVKLCEHCTNRLLHRDELTGVNPLLTAGLESICLVCAIYPLFGFATSLALCGTAQINTLTVLAFLDLLVTTAGYISLLLGTVWLIFF